MKNKIVLLIGLSGLSVISAFTFQLTNATFEKHSQLVNFSSETIIGELTSSFAEKTDINKTLIASYSNQKLIINKAVKESVAKPNILFFIADDMTSIDCEPYGNKDVRTPNLAKLAKEGLTFDNMNNATAMCGPTRQSLYTGLFPVKNGSYPNHAQVYDNVITVVQHFKKLGYRVALIGKQHYAPMANFPFEYLGGRNSDNGIGKDVELADAEKWINKDTSKPYLLIVASNQPHGPWTRGDVKKYDANKINVAPYMIDTKETRSELVKYYAEITYMDSLVGTCTRMVENQKTRDNTLFLFASEHGSSMPFAKWTCYNMGLKAAFIARWPKVIKPNTRTGILTQYIDVVPTLFEAAGGNPETLRGNKEGSMKLDGKSFFASFNGKPKEVRDYVFGVHTTRGIKNGSDNYPVRSIQDHDYKLIWNLQFKEPFLSSGSQPKNKLYNSWLKATNVTPKQAEHAKLYRNRPEFELYNIKKDVYELDNLADDSKLSAVKIKLLSELKKWMQDQGDKGIKTEAEALRRLKGDTLNWKTSGD